MASPYVSGWRPIRSFCHKTNNILVSDPNLQNLATMRSAFSSSGRGNEPQRALNFFHFSILNFTFPFALIYDLPAATYFRVQEAFRRTDTGLVAADGASASRHFDPRPLLNAEEKGVRVATASFHGRS